jgi:hypothetical protein
MCNLSTKAYFYRLGSFSSPKFDFQQRFAEFAKFDRIRIVPVLFGASGIIKHALAQNCLENHDT